MWKRDRIYLLSGFIIATVLSVLALKSESIAGFILIVFIYVMGILAFAKICATIRNSKRQNQILFVSAFFTGTGFYLKGFLVVFDIMSSENKLIRLCYSISAYLLIFVIMSMVILYASSIIFRGQRVIKK